MARATDTGFGRKEVRCITAKATPIPEAPTAANLRGRHLARAKTCLR